MGPRFQLFQLLRQGLGVRIDQLAESGRWLVRLSQFFDERGQRLQLLLHQRHFHSREAKGDFLDERALSLPIVIGIDDARGRGITSG